MIRAKEATRMSVLNSKLKSEMNVIERAICDAAKAGRFDVTITNNGYENSILVHLKGELESYGYTVKYEPPKDLPAGCPSDQWDFNGYLKISWPKE